MQVRRLGTTHAGEIRGVDLSAPLSDAERGRIMEALLEHKVLVFPEQSLDKAQLVAITRRFGPLGEHILPGVTGPTMPQVAVASNAGADGKPNGRHTDVSALRWHTDRSFMPRPAAATLFYAVAVPESGGDTLFADTTAAYRELPAALKARIEPLHALHWIGHSRDPRNGGLGGITRAELDQAPPVRHRLARVHEQTGEKALYCGCHAWQVEGMDATEGRALLDEVVAYATQARFVYRHKWHQGDLLMWDNRCTLHAGTNFAADRELRLMYRTIVEAEVPD